SEVKFQPPKDVRRRQFVLMSKWMGVADVREFALVVEGWTQKERTEFLEKFYQWRQNQLRERASGEEKKQSVVRDVLVDFNNDDKKDVNDGSRVEANELEIMDTEDEEEDDDT